MKRGIQFLVWLIFACSVSVLVSFVLLSQTQQRASSQEINFTPKERAWLDEHGDSIRYAPHPNAPPLDYIKNGKHLGLTPDYIEVIEQRLDIQLVQVESKDWAELLEKLKTKQVDMVGSIQNTEDRHSFLKFTEPYEEVPTVILVNSSNPEKYTVDNLQDLTIAVVESAAVFDHVKTLHPEYNFKPVKTAKEGLNLLSMKQVTAMIIDMGAASHYIEEQSISNIRNAGEIGLKWELCLASREDWPELNGILNKALASIPDDDRKAIYDDWFSLDNTGSLSNQSVALFVGAMLLVTLLAVGAVMLWNRTLKKQVRHRTHELGQVRQSHQRATRALDQSEERFRTLVESSSDMIWETDRQGYYTYVSPRVRDILGYEPEQVVGQSAFALQDQADASRNMERLRKATVETVLECETNTHIHKSGRKVILETSGMAFADNTGQLAGFRGVSRDITERVENDAALRASEERFRNLVETTSDWIWEVDTRGVFTYVSPQVGELLGYTPDELIGRRFTHPMPRPEAEAMETLFAELAEQGAPIHSMVNINRHKDGKTVVFETSAVPFYDKAWNIMGYRGIDRDITERMAIEKQLDFERNLFRSFMEHAPDLIYFKDREGRFIEVNHAKSNEVNLTPDEVIGKTDFDFLPEEEARQKYEDELEVMRTEKPMQKEEVSSTVNGQQWYLTTKVPRYDEKGKVVGTFGTSWNITYRKKAAEELRQLRAQLSNIIDSMPSVLVGVGADGCVTQWNREAERITKIAAADAAGKPLRTVFPRLAKEMVKVERAIRERATQKEERIRVREASRTRYYDITVYPLLENDAEGAVIRVDDVTDRVLIEDSIRNIVEGVASVGREFFRSMVNQLAKSLDADFAFISEYSDDHSRMHTIAVIEDGKAVDNFDYSLNGTPCERVLSGDICIFASDVRKHFPTTELLQIKEIESYIGIALVDSEGTPLGVMAAMYRNPVEQVEFATSVMQVFAGRTAAELERLQATKELLQLRNLLSNIINSMPSTLVGVDADSRVMQWNREAERMTGTPADQAQGKLLKEVFTDLGSEMDRVLEAISHRELQHDEHIPYARGDEQRFADVTVYPLTTEGTEGAVIRVDDVTDRVRIEEMMVQSEKMMSVGGLAAGMAHEINNPLAGILQNLQVMRNRVVHNTERNMAAASEAGTSLEAIQTYMHDRGLLKMMDSVTEAGRRAAKIVDNMLSFSRKDEAHYAPNNLEELLERSIDLASNDYNLKKRFDFRHIRIEREYDPSLDPIPCEGSQIQQVILNLLTNSAQAMAEHAGGDSKTPCITLRLKREAGMALIEVEDNGPGMTAETRKRAFEPFFTTKEVGHGTGLGLSVSYFIITENHGGTMLLQSTPGQGACFSIRIPFEHRQTMWGLRL